MVITAVRSRAVSLPLAPVPYSTERGGTKRGYLNVPLGPGLGVTLDEAKLRHHQIPKHH